MWRSAVRLDSGEVVCVTPRVHAGAVDRSALVDVCGWSMSHEDDARRRRHCALSTERGSAKEAQCIFDFPKPRPQVVRRPRKMLNLRVVYAE